MEEEFEMPTPCQCCGDIFDLNDGIGSEKWYPGTVICETCARIEEKEIEIDDEIENCKNNLSDAEWTIKDETKNLEELSEKLKKIEAQADDRRADRVLKTP